MNSIIQVKNVSKTFKIPHEKENSLRGTIFHFWKRKYYDEFKALQNVSFEVEEGEFLGILGKNGSGKSTLLKILSKIYVPDEGQVIIRGKVSPFLELGVGFNGELTARENIFLNGTILGLTEDEVRNKFDDIVGFAELEQFVDTKIKNFSSGMYARLAFAIAIQADADIYIMDEVLAVGDAEFQQKCFEVFTDLIKAGKTIILVSHDTEQLQKFCTNGILLTDGKVSPKRPIENIIADYQKLIKD